MGRDVGRGREGTAVAGDGEWVLSTQPRVQLINGSRWVGHAGRHALQRSPVSGCRRALSEEQVVMDCGNARGDEIGLGEVVHVLSPDPPKIGVASGAQRV